MFKLIHLMQIKPFYRRDFLNKGFLAAPHQHEASNSVDQIRQNSTLNIPSTESTLSDSALISPQLTHHRQRRLRERNLSFNIHYYQSKSSLLPRFMTQYIIAHPSNSPQPRGARGT
jgi:hypothetical protein